jgi:hypothetical protein
MLFWSLYPLFSFQEGDWQDRLQISAFPTWSSRTWLLSPWCFAQFSTQTHDQYVTNQDVSDLLTATPLWISTASYLIWALHMSVIGLEYKAEKSRSGTGTTWVWLKIVLCLLYCLPPEGRRFWRTY